jgi:phosphatidate cytidylyltransferase
MNPLLGLIALPLSIVSQFGDLAASVIKRRFGVKDYGKIFPGHGGVLDRFDSIIPVAIITLAFFVIII